MSTVDDFTRLDQAIAQMSAAMAQGDHGSVVSAVPAAIELAVALGDEVALVTCEYLRGNAHVARGEHVAAHEALADVTARAKALGVPRGRMELALGDAIAGMGRLTQADHTYGAALTSMVNEGDWEGTVLVSRHRSRAGLGTPRFVGPFDASELYEVLGANERTAGSQWLARLIARRIAGGTVSRVSTISRWFELVTDESYRGRTREARLRLDAICHGLTESGVFLSPSQHGRFLCLLGTMAVELGIRDRDLAYSVEVAVSAAELAQPLVKSTASRRAFARLCAAITKVYYLIGESSDADRWATASLGIAKTLDRETTARVYAEIGAGATGEVAERYLVKGLNLARRLGNPPFMIDILLSLGLEAVDYTERVAYLDEVERRLPAALAHYGHGERSTALGEQVRAVLAVRRAQLFLETDPHSAAAEIAQNLAGFRRLGHLGEEALIMYAAVADTGVSSADRVAAAHAVARDFEVQARYGGRRRIEDSRIPVHRLLSALCSGASQEEHRAAGHLIDALNRGSVGRVAAHGTRLGAALERQAHDTSADVHDQLLAALREITSGTGSAQGTRPAAALQGRAGLSLSLVGDHSTVKRGFASYVSPTGHETAFEFWIDPDLYEATSGVWAEPWRTSEILRRLSAALLGPIADSLKPDLLECGRLVLAPGDAFLAGLPWPALVVDETPLVELAALQLTPALSVLSAGSIAHRARTERGLLYTTDKVADMPALNVEREVEAWRSQATWQVEVAESNEQFLAALAEHGRWDIGYLAGHGVGSGLKHMFKCEGGNTIGIQDALSVWWPRITILSSCHVGSLDTQAGTDPLGLPLACLLKGAHFVVGCNTEVDDVGAAAVGTVLIERLAAHGDPVLALREAQMARFRETSQSVVIALGDWAPFQVVSTL